MSIPMAPSSEILIDEIKKSLIFKEKRLDYIEMEITMLNNIICSLIASGIWAMIVVIFSPQIIKNVKKIMVSLMDSGSVYVFSSYSDKEFIKDLKYELKHTKNLRICTSRGSFLMDSLYRECLNKKDIPIWILLPNTRDNKWIKIRTSEVNASGDGYTEKAFIGAIESNIEFLHACKGSIKIKLYDCIHIGRIVLTDRVAYFCPYLANTYGEDVPVYKYAVNSIKYNWIMRLFQEMWSVASVV
ncbi:hypothetical protein G4422_15420 [Blautia wexlerae]|jgi:hypothetical protein|uniref:hypothetical protein n=1 Tax=Blautia wexlerae TaxID=418240 RepID=UPI001570FD4D|nr:hypothetical protein [Blautia wexlerae]NSE04773.1 hypothetical protein [Blautia wexlerae]NSF78422.1 hypothetical protein [Blautia wexlerae]